MEDKNERRKVLVNEMYEIIASSSSELSRLEEIVDELIRANDSDNIQQLIMMNVNIRDFRLKFSILNKSIIDKKFNIIALCRKLHKS